MDWHVPAKLGQEIPGVRIRRCKYNLVLLPLLSLLARSASEGLWDFRGFGFWAAITEDRTGSAAVGYAWPGLAK